MKFLVVLAVAIACVSADVTHLDSAASILKSEFQDNPDGSFNYAQETSNGIYSQAAGSIKNPNSEYPSLEVNGAFQYTAPDGTPIAVNYVANENGFQPSGSHLPVSPPIPEYINRALAYIAAHPPSAEASAPRPNYG